MKTFLAAMALVMAAAFLCQAQDGGADYNLVVAAGDKVVEQMQAADVNHDGTVDMADIATVISVMAIHSRMAMPRNDVLRLSQPPSQLNVEVGLV